MKLLFAECRNRLAPFHDSLRDVAELLLVGHSNLEIARIIGRTVRSVEMKKQMIRRAWTET